MNPFVPIFVILAITVVINHLTGQLITEISGIVALVLFAMEYRKWRYIQDSEPDFLYGNTNRVFFLEHRTPLMNIAWSLGIIVVILTAIRTFGIFAQ